MDLSDSLVYLVALVTKRTSQYYSTSYTGYIQSNGYSSESTDLHYLVLLQAIAFPSLVG